jgi:hypothetical protein
MKTSLLIALLCIVAVVMVAAALRRLRRSSPMYRRRFANGAPMKPSLADSSRHDANAAVWYPIVLMSDSSPAGSNCDAGSAGAGDGGCSGGGGAD